LIVPIVVVCLLAACLIIGLGSFLYIAFQEVFQGLPQEFPLP
jgi:hypothetical protein